MNDVRKNDDDDGGRAGDHLVWRKSYSSAESPRSIEISCLCRDTGRYRDVARPANFLAISYEDEEESKSPRYGANLLVVVRPLLC